VKPGHDAMVRDWYRGTAAWMQSREHHDTHHLNHARAMFPDDADLLFLSGCQREAYASPAIQAVVRAAVLPSGFSLDVGSDRLELGEAENFFRRATGLNPQLVEGRLRLGRVLLLRGKPQEAADQLREVMTSSAEPIIRYYGALFLGAAEEELGHWDEARARYTQAADLYPAAQSPHLALSALARRRGDRAGALREIDAVFELPSGEPEFSDPWWTYHVVQARNAEELIEQVRERIR